MDPSERMYGMLLWTVGAKYWVAWQFLQSSGHFAELSGSMFTSIVDKLPWARCVLRVRTHVRSALNARVPLAQVGQHQFRRLRPGA